MNNLDKQYINLLQDILNYGEEKENRTNVNTISSFNKSLTIDLREGFPLLTTRKIFYRGVFEEMQFFLRGQTNTKILEEKKVNYWKGNTSKEFLNSRGLDYLPEGELGCGYSHQYRNFNGEHSLIPDTKGLKGYDQLSQVIETIKKDPWSRRNIISLWCPTQLDYMALPPCHLYVQFLTNPKLATLDCFFLMRSNDVALGLPTNIIQYALLTNYIAKMFDLQPRYLGYTGVDAHIYMNHLDALKEQIAREPKEHLPSFNIKKEINSLDDILNLEFNDIAVENYDYHPNIKMDMVI